MKGHDTSFLEGGFYWDSKLYIICNQMLTKEQKVLETKKRKQFNWWKYKVVYQADQSELWNIFSQNLFKQ